MQPQAGAADFNRFRGIARTPELFGQLREGNRRRVSLDPTPKILDALAIGHVGYCVVTVVVATPVRPELSVTVSRTVKVLTLGYV